MTIKRFDCVEMKRLGALRLQQHLRGKPADEQSEFWKRKTEELERRADAARRKNAAA